jgi:hypothetical protein
MLQNGMIYRKFKSVLVDQEINARMPTPQEKLKKEAHHRCDGAAVIFERDQ